jgi:uncharacterized phiE125 gp8 family phage protein
MLTNISTVPNDAIVIVSLARAKKHLRIESTYEDEDDLIQSYIDAAIAISEDFIGGHIQEKQMIIQMDKFENPLLFEAFPLQSVASVSYYPLGSETPEVVAVEKYSLTAVNAKVYNLRFKDIDPAIAERFDAVNVSIKIGYPSGKTPKAIIQSLLLQLADMYERREDRAAQLATAAMVLLRPYKKY